jgi:hypothetical protein
MKRKEKILLILSLFLIIFICVIYIKKDKTKMKEMKEKISLLEKENIDYHQLIKEILIQKEIQKLIYNPNNLSYNKIVLITDLYNNKERNNEIILTLQKNLLNFFIEEIHLILSPDQNEEIINTLINKEKIKIFKSKKIRLTFGDMFEHSNKYLNNKIVVISNNDIIFDETLIHVRDLKKNINETWIISRRRTIYNIKELKKIYIYNDMCFPYNSGSHDVFIFYQYINEGIINLSKDIYLGSIFNII